MPEYKDSGGNSSFTFVGNIVIDNQSAYEKVHHNKKTRLKSLEDGYQLIAFDFIKDAYTFWLHWNV